MATAYNEVTNSNMSGDVNSLDPMFRWETQYPDSLSQVHEYIPAAAPAVSAARRRRNLRSRNTGRFKTQPITFDEIKEVDENETPLEEAKNKLLHQFTAFSKSMDGLVPGTKPRSSSDAGLHDHLIAGAVASAAVDRVSESSSADPDESHDSDCQHLQVPSTSSGDSAEAAAAIHSQQRREHDRRRRKHNKKKHGRSIEADLPEVPDKCEGTQTQTKG